MQLSLKSHFMAITLKQQLILSIKALDLYKDTPELKDLTASLENSAITIPNEGDEIEIAGLILELVNRYPEIYDDLNNHKLKVFCLNIKSPSSEVKYTPPIKK